MNPMQRTLSGGDSIDSDALDWFVRRTGGGFGANDEEAFQAWLAADAGHRRAYQRQQDEWTALDDLPVEGLNILRANLRADQAPPPMRRRLFVPAFSAAALVAVAGVGGVIAWNQWQASPVFAQGFSTQRGEQREVSLPDGSRLRLDTATRAKVTYYRQRREVSLAEGQVFLRVASDASKPFAVLAGPLRVTVVGTRFSVRHTPGMPVDDGVRVAVEEGRVRVERIDGGAPDGAGTLFLGAGQQASSDATGVLQPAAPVSVAGIALWRENRVSFDNTRLDQVLAELERYGDTRLAIHDPAVASLRVTGTFNPVRLDSFVRALPQTTPVRLRDANGTGIREIAMAR